MRGKKWPFLIVRQMLGLPQHPDFAAEEAALIRRHPGSCDEVWLSAAMGFPTLDEQERFASGLVPLADTLRECGVSIALSLPNEIGHAFELTGPVSGVDWDNLMNFDGQAPDGCACPRDPRLLAYFDRMIRIYVRALHPSAVWLNDDMRLNHHGKVSFGCFCPRCLRDFSRYAGRAWTRQELAAALNDRSDADSAVRREWSRFNEESLAGLAGTIANAAHSIDPDCRMGLQLCAENFYSGSFVPILEAMRTDRVRQVGIRPGGGYYDDHAPRKMLDKGFQQAMRRALEAEGAETGQICYEGDNYPHTASGKSPYGTVLEAALALASGCDSVSLYFQSADNRERPEWYEKYFALLARWRPYLEAVGKSLEKTRPYGIVMPYGAGHRSRPFEENEPDWNWTRLEDIHHLQMLPLGLPLVPAGEGPIVFLNGDNARGFSAKELKQIFRGNVLMDGAAVAVLQTRKLPFRLGVAASERTGTILRERFSADRLNGSHAGETFFLGGKVYSLRTEGNARILGRLCLRFSEEAGQPEKDFGEAAVLLENELGGRCAVFGYVGIAELFSMAKREQLLRACDWLAGRGGMKIRLESPSQVAVYPRCAKNGKLSSAAFFNLSIGPAEDIRVRIPSGNSAVWLRPGKRPLRLKSENSVFSLPPLDGFGTGLLRMDR